ncbi:MAG TPA: Slp family lipoprotein [Nitrospirota bacterium]
MIRSGCHRAFVAVLLIILPVAFPVAGCAPIFPREAMDQVNTSLAFSSLRNNPDQFKGQRVMLAGVIISSKNSKDGTYLEVLQKPMNSRGRPEETDESEGRFIAQSAEFLDAAVYRTGRQITVIGEVLGRKELPLDEILYAYPLLAVKHLHLWEPYSGPRFFFGVGVSGHI